VDYGAAMILVPIYGKQLPLVHFSRLTQQTYITEKKPLFRCVTPLQNRASRVRLGRKPKLTPPSRCARPPAPITCLAA
jgi:hypothetical protein